MRLFDLCGRLSNFNTTAVLICIAEWKYHLLFMHEHILMYMNTLMHFLFYICSLCPMRLTYNWQIYVWHCVIKVKHLDVHSGLKMQHSESLFLTFEAVLTPFLSTQHLVHDGVGLYRWHEGSEMERSTKLGKWINERWIVKSQSFSHAKSISLFCPPCEDFAGHIWPPGRISLLWDLWRSVIFRPTSSLLQCFTCWRRLAGLWGTTANSSLHWEASAPQWRCDHQQPLTS